jgi:hypothetical protein
MTHGKLLASAIVLVAAVLAGLGVFLPESPSKEPRQALTVSVEGPATIAPGELAVLSAVGDAPRLAWRAIPATPHFLAIDGGRRAVFTSPQPGDWTFVLAAADAEDLVQTTHVLHVTGAPGPPPPPASLASLVRTWRQRVASPAVSAEAERLALSFESVAAQIAAGTIKTSEAVIQATASANQAALGTSREAWRPFFESLRVELNRREESGPLDYPVLWREIAGGLRS